MSRTIALVSAVVIAGGSGTARAAPKPKVAVTSLTTHGVNKAAIPGFSKSLSGGLVAGGLEATELQWVQAALKKHAGLTGCETAVCLKRIGALLKVPYCGRATVEMSGSTTFRIEVTVTTASTGKVAARLERRCDLCTLQEAREALSQAARDAAMRVLKDKRPVAPPRLKRPPPVRRRVVRRPPPRRKRPFLKKTVTVDTGKTYRLVGIAGLAVGAALIVPGIVLAALDGNDAGSCDDPLYARCRYTTMSGGAAMLGIGGAVLATGAALLVYGLLKRKTERALPVAFGFDPKRRAFLATGRLEF